MSTPELEPYQLLSLSEAEQDSYLDARHAKLTREGNPLGGKLANDARHFRYERMLRREKEAREAAERKLRENAPPVPDLVATEADRRATWMEHYCRSGDTRPMLEQFAAIPITGWPPGAEPRITYVGGKTNKDTPADDVPPERELTSLERQAAAMMGSESG